MGDMAERDPTHHNPNPDPNPDPNPRDPTYHEWLIKKSIDSPSRTGLDRLYQESPSSESCESDFCMSSRLSCDHAIERRFFAAVARISVESKLFESRGYKNKVFGRIC